MLSLFSMRANRPHADEVAQPQASAIALRAAVKPLSE
jgi:hypothetical protein